MERKKKKNDGDKECTFFFHGWEGVSLIHAFSAGRISFNRPEGKLLYFFLCCAVNNCTSLEQEAFNKKLHSVLYCPIRKAPCKKETWKENKRKGKRESINTAKTKKEFKLISCHRLLDFTILHGISIISLNTLQTNDNNNILIKKPIKKQHNFSVMLLSSNKFTLFSNQMEGNGGGGGNVNNELGKGLGQHQPFLLQPS